MASHVTAIERLAERAMPVETAAIESEFDRIWRETEAAGTGESSVRLRVLNFVAIGRETPAIDRFELVMSELPQRHPCRGVLAVTAEGQPTIEASISAHCWPALAGGRRHVCSEEVLLLGGPAQQRALASAVLSLLVPELPVALWVTDLDLLRGRLADDLVDSADRVFIDTADGADAVDAMQRALHVREAHDAPVSDLAWYRLAMWRGLIAQLFDGEEGGRELTRLRSIEITTGGAPAAAEALLLAGWFMSRLRLVVADESVNDDGLRLTLSRGIEAIRLSVSRGERVTGDAITSVRLRTADADFMVELDAEQRHMRVQQRWPDGPQHRVVECERSDDAAMFDIALDDPLGSEAYLEAVRAVLGAVTQ